jgi:MFS family permease
VRPAGGGPAAGPYVTWREALTDRWALVAVAALLYWVASHSLRPFVVVRLDELGASPQEIGFVAAAYAFVALFLAVPGGRAIDRIGITRVMYGSLVAMVLLGVAYAFADTILALLVLQVVNGVVELFVWLSVQTLATHAGTGEGLAKQLSLFSFMWGLGIAIGPTLGGLVYDRLGFSALALVYAGVTALLLLCLVFAPRAPAGIRTKGGRLGRDAVRTARLPAIRGVLVSSFVAMYVISIKSTFYPLLLQDRGIDLVLIGVLLSLMGIASLAVRVCLPWLLRTLGPSRVLALGSIAGIVGISVTPWLVHPALLVLGALVTGAGYGSNPPVAMQLLGTHSSREERGLAMGLRAASSRLAQVIQPVVFGSLAALVGTALTFPISGLLLAAVAVSTRRDMAALREPPPAPDPPASPSPQEDPP